MEKKFSKNEVEKKLNKIDSKISKIISEYNELMTQRYIMESNYPDDAKIEQLKINLDIAKSMLAINDSDMNYTALNILKENYEKAKRDNIQDVILEEYLNLINDIKLNRKVKNPKIEESNLQDDFNNIIKEDGVKSKEDAIDKYIKKYKTFPFFNFINTGDKYLMNVVDKSLKEGNEIEL